METLTVIYQHYPSLFFIAVAVFGLAIGSFLNVVIYRIPLMLYKSFRQECHELLEELKEKGNILDKLPATFSLLAPRSQCPSCNHMITAWQNIPVLSYLLLKGQCGHCGALISKRYPFVEILTAMLSVVVIWQLGVTVQAFAALILTWSLVAMSFIDIDEKILPDNITLPLMWLGLLMSLWHVFVTPEEAIIGAIAGYLALWSVYWCFKLVTGKEGMGYGDFKLLALFGAWLGWKVLPIIILLSSLLGAIVGVSMIVSGKQSREVPIPFGPYLAIAGWIALLWGDAIIASYFEFLRA